MNKRIFVTLIILLSSIVLIIFVAAATYNAQLKISKSLLKSRKYTIDSLKGELSKPQVSGKQLALEEVMKFNLYNAKLEMNSIDKLRTDYDLAKTLLYISLALIVFLFSIHFAIRYLKAPR